MQLQRTWRLLRTIGYVLLALGALAAFLRVAEAKHIKLYMEDYLPTDAKMISFTTASDGTVEKHFVDAKG
ncbi:MAG: hypothetical protein JOZ38_02910, partial [Candidatus Eremiobacteraeota bacterium]|nr:hypothetical protein [Candidatus Eremiobacteraeota bacterium]